MDPIVETCQCKEDPVRLMAGNDVRIVLKQAMGHQNPTHGWGNALHTGNVSKQEPKELAGKSLSRGHQLRKKEGSSPRARQNLRVCGFVYITVRFPSLCLARN